MKIKRFFVGLLVLSSALLLVACNQPNNEKPEEHEHTFASEWSTNATFHWHDANCEHVDEMSDKAAHSWDEGVITVEPTTEVEGFMTYTCTVCSYSRKESLGKLEEQPHEHTFASEWSKDETHHWYAATCEHSDETKDKAEHSWDEGTVTTEPTLDAPGVKTYSCTCGQTKTEPIDQLQTETHEHTFASEWSHDDNNHWHECSCGDKADLASHTGGTATTDSKAVCSVCGTSYGELAVAQDIMLGFWTNDWSNSDGWKIYIYAWTDNGYAWFECTLTDDNGAFGDYYTVTLTGYTSSNIKGFLLYRGTQPSWDIEHQKSVDLSYNEYLNTLNNDGKVTYYL